ncbi:cytochrome P450 [Aspergillus uvarum CBS 121591]|uniref:Cytochrome P450 n=1 Tax=Aspergillus uvarum CBS 121591 TaxID=1448315 RepID=A0A319C646_9EURO|nr:cytochrome P450 [Aspergillus uvarum CBS 121591]PYH81306.1 cytochrome P450 [Aspergillus uvarum CBS 121591]
MMQSFEVQYPSHLSFGWLVPLLVLPFYILVRLIYLLKFHPLSKYPGPPLWAITRAPWAYHVMRGDLWLALDRFHDRYGPVVRIAPDELTYISPGVWPEIYNARPQLNKDPHSLTPPLNGADSLFTAMGEDHRRIRAAFVNAFSDKALRGQAVIIEDHASQFITRLATEARAGNPVDIQRLVGYATFDIISELTWGEAPRALQSSERSPDWIQRFFLHAQFSTVRNCLTRFSPLDKILWYSFLRITSRQRIQNTRLSTERIERRLSTPSTRSDFMTPLVGKITEHGDGKGITKSEVLTNGLAVVIANSQLSTIAITTAIYLLLRHPIQYERLLAEIRAAPFDSTAAIDVSATASLPYLRAVLDEALRLHHPTPGSMPRVVGHGGLMVHGEFVPAGTVVGVSLWNIQTRPENFHRPRQFHPERFLPPTDPRYDPAFNRDCLDAYQPFSLGPRKCIGYKVFLAEARVLLTRLLWTFELQLEDAHMTTWLKQRAWLVFEPKPLKVQIRHRRPLAAS